MIESPVYNELNKAWKSTCRILFGEEIGELKDNSGWLSEFIETPRIEKSVVSRKDTYSALDDFSKGSSFISFDEIDFSKKFDPLNVNEIKDIDSILDAIRERIRYTGNLVLGNSRFVEESSNITDGTYIYKTFFADACQNIAYSSYFRGSKFVFGSRWGAFSNYLIRSLLIGPNCQRCYESFWIIESSDIYYSGNIDGCSDCMFSFNLKGKRRAIGNLELQPDKYRELKKKLLSEIVHDIKTKRTSLYGLLSGLPREKLALGSYERTHDTFDPVLVDDSFRKTFQLVLKQDPIKLDGYENFLLKHRIPRVKLVEGTASAGEVRVTETIGATGLPIHRLISEAEASALLNNPRRLSLDQAENLSLADTSALSKVAFMPFGLTSGNNRNLGESIWNYNATNCRGGLGYVESRDSAYCFWPRNSSYMFGSAMSFESSFCINTNHSKKMTRTFEADSCTNCSDAYFLHNCENVRDSMFCFNSKNLSYAVGNSQLSREQYRAVKNSLIGQIADELIRNKDLKWDIYNIGCKQ